MAEACTIVWFENIVCLSPSLSVCIEQRNSFPLKRDGMNYGLWRLATFWPLRTDQSNWQKRTLNFYSYFDVAFVRCIKLNSLHFNSNWHMTSGDLAFENVSFIAINCAFSLPLKSFAKWKTWISEREAAVSHTVHRTHSNRTERNGTEWLRVDGHKRQALFESRVDSSCVCVRCALCAQHEFVRNCSFSCRHRIVYLKSLLFCLWCNNVCDDVNRQRHQLMIPRICWRVRADRVQHNSVLCRLLHFHRDKIYALSSSLLHSFLGLSISVLSGTNAKAAAHRPIIVSFAISRFLHDPIADCVSSY